VNAITPAYAIRPGDPPPPSQLERLLTAPITRPFNGDGSMAPAFTTRSGGWKGNLEEAKANGREKALRAEREGERLVMLSWIRAGAPAKEWNDETAIYEVPKELAEHPITEEYLVMEGDKPVKPRKVLIKKLFGDRCQACHDPNGKSNFARKAPLDSLERIRAYCDAGPSPTAAGPRVRIRTLIQDRCVRCHTKEDSASDKARRAPMDSYEQLAAYTAPQTSAGMPVRSLAQTTHVHLLGFAMLFALTGIVFSFTSYPFWVRVLFGPFTLVAQVLDISCWWLGRLHPLFAEAILVTGGLVALGLMVQILGSLLNMFAAARTSG
jgi:hypothetical protein